MNKRRHIEPPPGMDPLIAEFIAELAREAVRRQAREALVKMDTIEATDDDKPKRAKVSN